MTTCARVADNHSSGIVRLSASHLPRDAMGFSGSLCMQLQQHSEEALSHVRERPHRRVLNPVVLQQLMLPVKTKRRLRRCWTQPCCPIVLKIVCWSLVLSRAARSPLVHAGAYSLESVNVCPILHPETTRSGDRASPRPGLKSVSSKRLGLSPSLRATRLLSSRSNSHLPTSAQLNLCSRGKSPRAA